MGRPSGIGCSRMVRGWRLRSGLGRSPSVKLGRGVLPLGFVEFALELLVVDVDFLLDRLFSARERLVELLFKARLPDDEQCCLPGVDEVAQLRKGG
jgi:hypothetical protein